MDGSTSLLIFAFAAGLVLGSLLLWLWSRGRIAVLNERREHLVFLLWGSYAQKKGAIVDRKRHCVLTAPHPSPLSAHRGFFGCRHFSAANAYLEAHGQPAIDWFRVT